jgi:CheY-like chemotaxis protein
MDGPAFLIAYQQTPSPHPPVVLITGSARRADLQNTPGVVASLPKPFRLDEFSALVARCLEASPARQFTPASTAA